MAYDTSNLPNVMQYLQQQQNQGGYVPSNGANGVPSQGWDGWGGYNPATTYQASSGAYQPQSGVTQTGGNTTPALSVGNNTPQVDPAYGGTSVQQHPTIQDGYLRNNFQMGTNSRSTDVGQSGYSRNDITAMHNDPSLAANTPFAQYLQGGKAGTGTPISFQGFYAQQANRAMNAGIDPSGMDYRSMIDQMTAQQRAARQATNQQQFAANQANTQVRQAMPTNGSIARAQPNYTYAKPSDGTLSGGPNNGHNMTYLTNPGNGGRPQPLGTQIGQLSPNPVTSGVSSPYASPNVVNSGVSSPYQPQSNTVPGTNYSLDDIHGFLNGAGGNKILGQGGPYRAI